MTNLSSSPAHASDKVATSPLRPIQPEAPRTPPVYVWASVGTLIAVVIVYTMTRWIVSGDATPTTTGSTPVPGYMTAFIVGQQAAFLIGSLIVGYLFVIRERRIPGHLTLNGMAYLCVATAWFQDSLMNWVTPLMSYNSALINFGSWNASVPGWVSPNAASMPSPIVWYLGMYPLVFCGGIVLFLRLMRRVQTRWNLSAIRLVLITFVTLSVLLVCVEVVFMRTGIYHYAGFPGPRIFSNKAYAVPVLVPVFDAVLVTAWASVLYFRNDKGETVGERGASELHVGRGRQSLLRFLGLFATLHVIYLVTFTIPTAFLGLHAHSWPSDVQQQSYFTNGVCGSGTTIACPGERIPIPKGDTSLRVDPEGRLVQP